MTDELRSARRYFSPPEDAFWEWREANEVVTWKDGTTIAFRAELHLILQRLAPNGLPPFGALLLLIAATRDSWQESPHRSSIVSDHLFRCMIAFPVVGMLDDVDKGLGIVHQLDHDSRSTLDARASIAAIVFEDTPASVSSEQANGIIVQLENGLGEDFPRANEGWKAVSMPLLRDIKCLKDGLSRLDPETLDLRHETSLDEVPQSVELEPDLPPADSVRALLKQLEDDAELCGLAKLTHDLMAAVTLPRAVTEREELQIGGVSDISNRGSLDRLLLSELAHDDLTLAVRINVNEAMYLRRESPPRTPPQQRTVFLETGLRSWGVPRVFATAIALALAATSEQNTEVLAYRAKGDDVEPVDLTTRDGLIEHLAALDTDLHPGRALGAFETAMAQAGNAVEPVLITCDDVLDDKEFQRELSKHTLLPMHVATVNRKGGFRLLEQTMRGRKMLREATLDLGELFKEPTKLIDHTREGSLPAIFSIEPFPLLMSHPVNQERMWCVPGRGVLSLTKDRRLMYWSDKNTGAVQLSDKVPKGPIWWSSHAPLNDVSAVVGYMDPSGLHRLRIDLTKQHCEVQHVDVERGVQDICSHAGMLFGIYSQKVLVLGLDGTVVQTLEIPGATFQRDRFFLHPSGMWYALSYNGTTACFASVVTNDFVKCLTLFEREGIDGPIGVTDIGDFYMTATDERRKVNHRLPGTIEVMSVSPNGRFVTLRSVEDTTRVAVVDVDTLNVVTDALNPSKVGNLEFHSLVRPTNLRHRFTHIGVDDEGFLTLVSRKHRTFRIVTDANSSEILLRSVTIGRLHNQQTFEPAETPSGRGMRLLRATWNDGSEAFIDSRGLLHLRSADQTIPEISIVLRDGLLAGWCSNGRLWGMRYFTGKSKGASQKLVYESSILAFTEQLR